MSGIPKAIFHIWKYSKDGSSKIVDTRSSGYIVGLMEAARQHGGRVLTPKHHPRTGEWAVIDDEGNLFLAIERQ